MQEQSPILVSQPVSEIKNLENFIALNALDHFKNALMMPIDPRAWLKYLSQALQHRAVAIIDYLSWCHVQDVTGEAAKDVFNLIYYHHAEFFRSNEDLCACRLRFLNKLHIKKGRSLLLAAVNGDVNALKGKTDIKKSSAMFHSLMLYAAANNQVEMVRLLDQHGHNLYDAMAAAITQNADAVFEYLLQADLYPNNKFAAESLRIAIQNGNLRMLRYLLGKGLALGHATLSYAAIYNQLDIVKELVNLKVDIKHSGAIREAICCNNYDILSYLLEQLNSAMTAQAMRDYLNSIPVFSDQMYASGYDHPVIFPSEHVNTKKIVDLLDKYRAICIFKSASDKTEPYELVHKLSYYSGVKQCYYYYSHDRLFFINLLVIDKISGVNNLTIEFLPIIEELERYFNVCFADRFRLQKTHFRNLSKCKKYLQALAGFTLLISRPLDNELLKCLAIMMACHARSALHVILDTIIEAIQQTDSNSESKLATIVGMLQALPSKHIRSLSCSTIADRLCLKAESVSGICNSLFSVAKCLYKIADNPKMAEIQHKGDRVFPVVLPSDQQKQFISRELIQLAIDFDSEIFIHSLASSSFVESLDFFSEAIIMCRTHPGFLPELIAIASPALLNRIYYCLIYNSHQDEQIPKLLGLFLPKLTDNKPKLLFTLAHIITHYSVKIAQPAQVQYIFYRVLFELVNVRFDHNSNVAHLLNMHHQEVLKVISSIREEVNHFQFQHNISTQFLDDLEMQCNLVVAEELIYNNEDKRLITSDMVDSSPNKTQRLPDVFSNMP